MWFLIDQDSEKIFRSENFSDFRRKEDFEADEFSEHESFFFFIGQDSRQGGGERMRGNNIEEMVWDRLKTSPCSEDSSLQYMCNLFSQVSYSSNLNSESDSEFEEKD